MKKVCFIIMCFLVAVPLLTACSLDREQKESLIKYQSKLSQYTQGVVQKGDVKRSKVVDLSDGTQTHYDMRFAPKEPDFDVKINDPYSY